MFETYSVDPTDEMLALGGRPAAVRHDPAGHEDCAREWDPCQCHGDRLCQLGKLHRWMMSNADHTAWLLTDEAVTMYPDKWERSHKVFSGERLTRDFAREIWPLIVANARLEQGSSRKQGE